MGRLLPMEAGRPQKNRPRGSPLSAEAQARAGLSREGVKSERTGRETRLWSPVPDLQREVGEIRRWGSYGMRLEAPAP